MKKAGKIKRRTPHGTGWSADAYLWEAGADKLIPVQKVARLPLDLLQGIDSARDTLLENTRRFAGGLPANNALLWGARGMGKSSLVKALHGEVNAVRKKGSAKLILIEIHREEISSLPHLLRRLKREKRRFLLFCDDLSFDKGDTSYKSLKCALEGGIEGRPDNVLLYATSNRRHILAREMTENESSTAISPSEAAEEKVSLSDRFGLWLGFHNCAQDEFLKMIDGYAEYFALELPQAQLHARALAWAAGRGSRSGRVAWQFIQDLAGELGQTLKV